MTIADTIVRIDEGRFLPENFKAWDTAFKALVGSAPQVAETFRGIDSAIRVATSMDPNEAMERGGVHLGKYIASHLQILNAVKDIRSEFDTSYANFKESHLEGIAGPVKNVVTGAVGGYGDRPDLQSPIVEETPHRPKWGGLLRQLTGFNIRNPYAPHYRELLRLGYGPRQFSPKSGSKKFDAIIAKYQGQAMEQFGPLIVGSDAYKNAGVAAKKLMLRKLVQMTRQPALRAAQAAAPNLYGQVRLRRWPTTEMDFIQRTITGTAEGEKSWNRMTDDLSRAIEEEVRQELFPQP